MPDTIFDLHVHTTFGSLDSALTPERLMREAPHIGLHGAAVTEHRRAWSHDLLQRMRDDGGAFVSVSREVESDMGHLVVVDHQRPLPRPRRDGARGGGAPERRA
ncbi:MAG: PHP domain-containing protein [Dehalococcoidia bacterium]